MLASPVTADRVTEAVEREAVSLRQSRHLHRLRRGCRGCEPDARQYLCESCGAWSVYGAQELLFYLVA